MDVQKVQFHWFGKNTNHSALVFNLLGPVFKFKLNWPWLEMKLALQLDQILFRKVQGYIYKSWFYSENYEPNRDLGSVG